MNRIFFNVGQAILYICLLSPLVFSLVRKSLPGQPSWSEVIPLAVIPLIFVFSKGILNITPSIRRVLSSIILIYTIFLIFSVFTDYRIGVAAFFLRIVPILLVFIFFRYIVNLGQIHNISKTISWISLFLLPIAVWGVVFGNSSLPPAFSPIDSVVLGSREMRHEYSSISTIFTTHWTMAWSVVGFIGILGFSLLTFRHSMYEKVLIHSGVIASLIILYLTMRRGALVIGLMCALYVYFRNLKISRIFFLISVFFIFFWTISILDNLTFFDQNMSMSDSILRLEDVDLYHRFKLIFWNHYIFWMELFPFGSFLGSAGPEGRAFGHMLSEIYQTKIEVGGAQLVAEIGFFPHLLVMLSFFFLLYLQYRYSKNTLACQGVRVLILMQSGMLFMWFFKSALVLSNPHFGHLFFWASIGISLAAIQKK